MNFLEFKVKATKAVDDLSAQVESLPWERRKFYCSWLVQTHCFVEHTSRFLNLCRQTLGGRHHLKEQYDHHIEEEFGHEKLCENDLKFMQVTDGDIFIETKMFFKSQYYWIHEVSPTSHLGYSLLLEGLAAVSGPRILQRVMRAGFQGHTFLKVHAEEDHSHFDEALKAVESLTDRERDHVWTNLSEGLEIYLKILDRCVEAAEKRRSKAA